MELSKQEHCSVCWEILSDSETATKAIDILKILKFLLINTNHKLLQESLICETCLAKVQSAYKFKILYSEDSHKTLDNEMVNEKINSENLICDICKKILDPSDSVPFVNSESNRSTLIRHFSVKFESKVCDNQTCGECHKSLLNFCAVTNSVLIFEQNSAVINESVDTENINHTDDSNSNSFKVDIKKEFVLQDIKEEMEYALQDVKKESEDIFTSQEFVLKSEEVDLKADVDSEDETYWKPETRFVEKISHPGSHPFELNETITDLVKNSSKPAKNSKFQRKRTDLLVHKEIGKFNNMYQCSDCEFRTRYKTNLNRHVLVHSNDVEMFQCNVCNHHTKHKDSLKRHMLTHKNDDDVEIFRCNVCNFQSKRKDSLKIHLLIHKNDVDVEMFRCNSCNFQSKRKDGLRDHMLIHKNHVDIQMFQCKNCNFRSKRKSGVRNHMLTHKNEPEIKFFQCHICKYQTKRRHDLKRHVLVHKNRLWN